MNETHQGEIDVLLNGTREDRIYACKPFPLFKLCPCGYRNAYRLAGLAEVHGAEFKLDDLLFVLAKAKCPKWETTRLTSGSDVISYADLGGSNPPDVPPAVESPGC